MILKCNCTHGPNGVATAALQQDEMYGKGQRVQNETAKEGTYRCTVCGNTNTKGVEDKKKANKESAAEDPKGRTKKRGKLAGAKS